MQGDLSSHFIQNKLFLALVPFRFCVLVFSHKPIACFRSDGIHVAQLDHRDRQDMLSVGGRASNAHFTIRCLKRVQARHVSKESHQTLNVISFAALTEEDREHAHIDVSTPGVQRQMAQRCILPRARMPGLYCHQVDMTFTVKS